MMSKKYIEELEATNAKLLENIKENDELICRMHRSKSWKYTAWLRKLESWIKGASRQKRAAVFHPPFGIDPMSDIAVIITSHNYGCFLAEAIESVLAQTYKPRKILVVDDCSDDDTYQVALKYARAGVSYTFCDQNHPSGARNYGATVAKSPFLVFLDADDKLAPDYIAECRSAMNDPVVAVAYGNVQWYGEKKFFQEVPKFDRDRLFFRNFISSHAMIRSKAFDLVGGFRTYSESQEDWDIIRRILRYPWGAKKVNSTVYYRIHTNNRSIRYREKAQRFWHGANALENPITIFTPFTGNWDIFDTYFSSLIALDFNPRHIHVHWFDMSAKDAFGSMLKDALSTLPFGQTTYTYAPYSLVSNSKFITTNNYTQDEAMIYAYNNFVVSCNTEFGIILEEDRAPAPNALNMILKTIEDHATFAVVAPHISNENGHYNVWRNDPHKCPYFVTEPGSGIERVDGGSFGFALFRMSTMKKSPVYQKENSSLPRSYEFTAFEHIKKHGDILCNWDIHVTQLHSTSQAPLRAPVSQPQPQTARL